MKVRYFAVVNGKGEVYWRPGYGLAIFEDESSAAAYAKACHAGRVIELVEKPKRKAAGHPYSGDNLIQRVQRNGRINRQCGRGMSANMVLADSPDAMLRECMEALRQEKEKP